MPNSSQIGSSYSELPDDRNESKPPKPKAVKETLAFKNKSKQQQQGQKLSKPK